MAVERFVEGNGRFAADYNGVLTNELQLWGGRQTAVVRQWGDGVRDRC